MTKREDIYRVEIFNPILFTISHFSSPQVGLRFERLEEALSANFNSLQEPMNRKSRSRWSFDAENISLGWWVFLINFLSNLFW